jgi:hypothetical protein
MATSKSCYGLLNKLEGKWQGQGLTVISLPHFEKKDICSTSPFRFQAFLTKEKFTFKKIKDPIPDRGRTISQGKGQEDINMYGLEYKQKVYNRETGELIHKEKGELLNVPGTKVLPKQGRTILRMATIFHGNALIAQSKEISKSNTIPPIIPRIDVTPIGMDDEAKEDLSAPGYLDPIFKDVVLPTSGNKKSSISIKDIKNPNRLIKKAIKKLVSSKSDEKEENKIKILQTTTISLSTEKPSGGIVNSMYVRENANTTAVDSTLWIVKLRPNTFPCSSSASSANRWKLFYSQTVILEFDNIKWTHISVAELSKVV